MTAPARHGAAGLTAPLQHRLYGRDKAHGRHVEYPGDFDQFHDFNPPLPKFDLGDKRLRAAKPRREFLLRQTAVPARGGQGRRQGDMAFCSQAFGHTGPKRKRPLGANPVLD